MTRAARAPIAACEAVVMLLAVSGIVVSPPCRADDCPPGTIVTIAGTGGSIYEGPGQYPGDGGPATEAKISEPCDLALAPGASLYIADRDAHRIRKVDLKTGIITTFAGNGVEGYSGDGGPAVEANLKYPYAVALGPDGSLYIADASNDRVRKVDPAGVITTVAGTGTRGYSGDGGPATEAQLQAPAALALGPDGSLYIADPADHRVRKVCGPAPSQP